ncbi:MULTISPECIES: nucleotidyl transferase AbiEii/AbiGii toxin family protein [Clavibacter]|uniref:Nucleotidyl transferase AbiEii/AbiGii toxin family protein n=2 Tax=Clavibacter TaxID=1573 RepID=A0A399NY81_9MICO|nr:MULTISPECIES: nucleotidyl transferase AbiEii/AbiGii toxin family protein [Clavibacter]KDP89779.1 hypothetical protein W824_14900 [Clavibacter cf. michiganensis LMG 26808]RII99113.1 nucleotidyl transferase AbiEii/AbiGii toxin family protein [Clavibacter michiganensis]UKF26676.1 nucleotidyl transferase AbiEii/AbiGii toxin family protein [Clavibacter sp. A6099]
MPEQPDYVSGAAAGAAINSAARSAARSGSTSAHDLVTQTTFDRFLCRVFADDKPAFVLKGGLGMLARMPQSRATRDIDLAASEGDVAAAVEELIARVSVDLGDHFRFAYRSQTDLLTGDNQPYTGGCRVTFDAYLGVASRGKVDIDLAVGHMPTAQPERHVPANRLTRLNFRTHDYFLYPLVDQISDKLCATLQPYGPSGLPSSREKDLVDLAMIAMFQAVDAAELRMAIAQEFRLRGLEPTPRFTVPPEWGVAFRAMAARTPLAPSRSQLEDAVALVRALLDPVLDGSVTEGQWNPTTSSW